MVQQIKNYYHILGLSENASMDEIKKAYKNLAKKWHPDKNPGSKDSSEKKFKEISEAYRVLSDGAKRYDYDQERKAHEEEMNYNEKRNYDERIRRMAKEQQDYVRKQEARKARGRARAHHHPPFETDFTDFGSGSHDRIFQDFFADREAWRRRVPDLFKAEGAGLTDMMKEMNEFMKTFAFGDKFSEAHKGANNNRIKRGELYPAAVSADEVFNNFFNKSSDGFMSGFSYF